VDILGVEDKNYWKDNKGANINSIRTKKLIKDSDLIIVKFGEKYKQWNAAFDAGYAAALNKSIIVIHNEDHQHALKEIDAAASAVASNSKQVVRILKYIIQGEL
jgi:YtoQ family protein